MVLDFQEGEGGGVCVRERERALQSFGKQIGMNKIHFKIDGIDVV